MEREEREIEELEETRETLEAIDQVVESEFLENSTSGQDTSRWIRPYDPSSMEVLLEKGAIVARLLHKADLNCKGTALYKRVLVEDDRDCQQAAGDKSREDEDESDSDASSSSGDDKSSEDKCNITMLTWGMKFKSQQDFEGSRTSQARMSLRITVMRRRLEAASTFARC